MGAVVVAIPADNLRSGCTGAEPYAPWNYREPWEGRKCGECVYFVRIDGMQLCVAEACLDGYPAAAKVGYYEDACESFADELPRTRR